MLHWQLWIAFGALAVLGGLVVYIVRRCPGALDDEEDGTDFVAFF